MIPPRTSTSRVAVRTPASDDGAVWTRLDGGGRHDRAAPRCRVEANGALAWSASSVVLVAHCSTRGRGCLECSWQAIGAARGRLPARRPECRFACVEDSQAPRVYDCGPEPSRRQRRRPLACRPALVQPMAADDVAAGPANVATNAPANRTVELAGLEPFRSTSSCDASRVQTTTHGEWWPTSTRSTSAHSWTTARSPRATATRLVPTCFEDWLAVHPKGASTKPTIVLVHGAFAESSSWDGVVDPLLDAGTSGDRRRKPAARPCRGRRDRRPTSSARSTARSCSPPTPTAAQ